METPKIIVKNSCIQVYNYEFGSCPKLENAFRIYDVTTHSCYYLGLYYNQEKKILYLPRGIDIWYVEKILETKAYVERDMYNPFDKYRDIKIKYLPKDDVQKEALRFTLGKGEYTSTATKSQLSVNLNTGKGKTYISVATFSFTGIKTIIITYATNWLEQWEDRILEYTNLTKKDICFITVSGVLYRLMNSSEDRISQYKVFLVTHSTIKSYGDTHGWEQVGELFKHLKIGIKIFDEAHMNFSNMLMIDFFTNVYKTYYLTATAMRSDPRENEIYQMCMKNILSIELFNPEIDPHSDYCAILYNSYPSAQIISACKNQYGLDRNRYINYAVNSEEFFKLSVVLIDMITNILDRGKPNSKCLIYIGTNQAINVFVQEITKVFPEMESEIGIYTSIVSPEEKEKAKEKKFIITTTKSASACVDIPNLKVVLLLNEPFASAVLARQSLGRLRDNNTIYFEVVDTGFKQCKRFYSKKKPVFAKYAQDCQQTEISKTELEARYQKVMEKLEKRFYPIRFF